MPTESSHWASEGTNAAWGDMLNQAVVAYAAKRDTPKMRAHVGRLVMRAIEQTFVEKEQEVSDAEVEDVGARGLELRRATIAEQPSQIEREYGDDAGIDVDRDEDYDDEPVRPHRLRTRKRDVYIDHHPTASNAAGGDMLNQDIRGKKVRLDLGIKNVINVPLAGGSGARSSRTPVSNGPPIDPRMFDDFPLIYLVVLILGAVVRVPAQYNTTLVEVLGAVEKHPIRLLGMKGALAGRGQ